MTAYNYKCPHCHELLEFDEDPTGQTFDCISCGRRFTVYSVNSNIGRPARRSSAQPPPPKMTGCVWLGILFSVAGILISYLMHGQAGARAAFRGFIIQLVIGIVAALILVFMPFVETWIVS